MEQRIEENTGELNGLGCRTEALILLLDRYDDAAKKLHASFWAAGRHPLTLSVNEDGFLPEDVLSPYTYFLGDFSSDRRRKGAPLYFNEVRVPDYWKISGNGSVAEIYDLTQKRGIIRYTKESLTANRRLVKAVEWLDRAGVVRSIDHYNRYGAIYARTTCSAQGNPVVKTYFSVDDREVITENFVTKTIQLTEQADGRETQHFFYEKTDFVRFFMEKLGCEKNTIYYNSLSTPFFLTMQWKDRPCEDVLFWQEGPREEIPGNMRLILEGRCSTTKRIYVQNREAYEGLLRAGAAPEKISPLGFVYPFQRENGHGDQALICTNSDQIEQLAFLSEELPELHFHVAAKTEMSEKLLAMGKYSNITLYPAAKEATFETLFRRCDWYFDINHGGEIVSACEKAFLHNQILLGFFETVHHTGILPPEHICRAEHPALLSLAVKTMRSDPEILDMELKRQRSHAMAEEAEAYRRLGGGDSLAVSLS